MEKRAVRGMIKTLAPLIRTSRAGQPFSLKARATRRAWTPDSSRRCFLRNERGFTLIEVLIVIGLIALIMTVAIPSAGIALKVNIQNSSRELASTIRSSYDEAVLRGTVHRV